MHAPDARFVLPVRASGAVLEGYSAFFLRRNTITVINSIANAAQTIRTVEGSMVKSPLPDKYQFGVSPGKL